MGKITVGQIRLLILVLIAVVFLAGYRFGYQPLKQKTDEVNAESEDFEAKIKILDAKIAREKEYDEGLVNFENEAWKILDQYGGGNTPEKSIMMLVKLAEEAGMEIASVSFGSDSNIYYSSSLKTEGSEGVYMYKQPLTFSYQVSYEGLKRAMDFINNYKERMNVESVAASYDMLTGQLSGSMSLNLFSVIGGHAKYEAPTTGVKDIGTENIFGTYEVEEEQGEEENP